MSCEQFVVGGDPIREDHVDCSLSPRGGETDIKEVDEHSYEPLLLLS